MISIQLFGWENELEKKKDIISVTWKNRQLSAIFLRMLSRKENPTDDAAARLIGCYLRAKNNQSETPQISNQLRHRRWFSWVKLSWTEHALANKLWSTTITFSQIKTPVGYIPGLQKLLSVHHHSH